VAPHSESMYLSMDEQGAHIGRRFIAGVLSGIIDVTGTCYASAPNSRFCRPAAVVLRGMEAPDRPFLAPGKPPPGGPNLF